MFDNFNGHMGVAGLGKEEHVSLLKISTAYATIEANVLPEFSHIFWMQEEVTFYLLPGQIIDHFLLICLYVNPYLRFPQWVPRRILTAHHLMSLTTENVL